MLILKFSPPLKHHTRHTPARLSLFKLIYHFMA